MLDVFDNHFIDQPSGKEIVDLVINFLSFCNNMTVYQTPFKTTSAVEYPVFRSQMDEKERRGIQDQQNHMKTFSSMSRIPRDKKHRSGLLSES